MTVFSASEPTGPFTTDLPEPSFDLDASEESQLTAVFDGAVNAGDIVIEVRADDDPDPEYQPEATVPADPEGFEYVIQPLDTGERGLKPLTRHRTGSRRPQ